METSRGRATADEYGMEFFETSAKEGTNISKAFHSIARDIVERMAAAPAGAGTHTGSGAGASAGGAGAGGVHGGGSGSGGGSAHPSTGTSVDARSGLARDAKGDKGKCAVM